MRHHPTAPAICQASNCGLAFVHMLGYSPTMTSPAHIVVEKLGGDTVVADALKITRQAVNGWKLRGFVPYDRIPDVLKLARRRKVKLAPADFLPQWGEWA